MRQHTTKCGIFLLGFLLTCHPLIALGLHSGAKRAPRNPRGFGLFLVVSAKEEDGRALVLSGDGKPILPKMNEPDAPTVPGFYLSYHERLPFERVTVTSNEVFFKTRVVNRVRFEFHGKPDTQTEPDFDQPIPMIRGLLKKFRDGKLIGTERITFGHAVIY